MKAVLIAHETLAPRTHDLLLLSRMIEPLFPAWEWDEVELHDLNRAAVGYRYPGESADRDEAAEALKICDRLFEALRPLIDERRGNE